jgi:hypothetical protein
MLQAFELDKQEAENIERRRRVLIGHFQNRSVITCLLAPQGIKRNRWTDRVVDKIFPEDVLFRR